MRVPLVLSVVGGGIDIYFGTAFVTPITMCAATFYVWAKEPKSD